MAARGQVMSMLINAYNFTDAIQIAPADSYQLFAARGPRHLVLGVALALPAESTRVSRLAEIDSARLWRTRRGWRTPLPCGKNLGSVELDNGPQ